MMSPEYTLTAKEEEDIRKFLQKQEGREIICQHEMSGFWYHDEIWESEFRILFLMNFRLTVSRVNFIKKRQGTMTKVMEFLRKLCKEKGIADIVIQCVETPEMAQWCRKNHFNPIPNSSFQAKNGVILGDYIKNVMANEP